MKRPRQFYRFYYTAAALLSLAGLALSLYLFYSHYRNYTDIDYSSFCAISKAINCDTVSQSSWAILFNLPVALWGAMGYLLYLCFLVPAYKNESSRIILWSILIILSFIFSIAAIYFAYISTTKIHAYCILCICTYAISFILFLISWLSHRRFSDNSFYKNISIAINEFKTNIPARIATVLFIIGVASVSFFMPHYWQYTPPPMSENVATGITEDGHPWIGSNNPKLTIHEYTDYLCFQCYKVHYSIRHLIAKYPDKIRLVHHNYPMDHEVNAVVVPEPFHVGSGKMAQLAIYSVTKKKFWQTNDLLYKLGREKKSFNIKTFAKKTGIPVEELAWALQSKEIAEVLRYDIWHGMKLGIMGTPSFVIQKKVYKGTIPPEILKKALQ